MAPHALEAALSDLPLQFRFPIDPSKILDHFQKGETIAGFVKAMGICFNANALLQTHFDGGEISFVHNWLENDGDLIKGCICGGTQYPGFRQIITRKPIRFLERIIFELEIRDDELKSAEKKILKRKVKAKTRREKMLVNDKSLSSLTPRINLQKLAYECAGITKKYLHEIEKIFNGTEDDDNEADTTAAEDAIGRHCCFLWRR